jgi:hypothetical protein
MKRVVGIVVVVVALGMCSAARAQVELDATLTAVNGDVILKSDVLWNLALDPTVAPAEFWLPEIQDRMLRTLVDQRLLLQEAAKLPATRSTDEEVAAEINRIAGEFNTPDDQTRLEARMRLVGLDRTRLEEIARDRLQIAKFVDFRFRSFVVVTEPEVKAYFDTEVRPKLPDQTEGALNAVLEARRAEIEQALVEEKINNSIDVYLEDARARAEIVELN